MTPAEIVIKRICLPAIDVAARAGLAEPPEAFVRFACSWIPGWNVVQLDAIREWREPALALEIDPVFEMALGPTDDLLAEVAIAALSGPDICLALDGSEEDCEALEALLALDISHANRLALLSAIEMVLDDLDDDDLIQETHRLIQEATLSRMIQDSLYPKMLYMPRFDTSTVPWLLVP